MVGTLGSASRLTAGRPKHRSTPIEIYFLPAAQDPEQEEAALLGQRQCFRRYGLELPEHPPPSSETTWFVLARQPGRRIVGGARLEIKLDAEPLPIEIALRDDRRALSRIHRYVQRGLAELCGLWTAAEEAGTGLGAAIIQAGTAIAPFCDANVLVSFAHQMNWFTELVGFAPDQHLPSYAYPNERYQTRVYWCRPRTLETAHSLARWEILAMRSNLISGKTYCWDSNSSPLWSYYRRRRRRRKVDMQSKSHSGFKYLRESGESFDLTARFRLVESQVAPREGRLVGPLWGPAHVPRSASEGAYRLKLHTDSRQVGELCILSASIPGVAERLRVSSQNLESTALICDASVDPGVEDLLLYAAFRRARILGFTTVCAFVREEEMAAFRLVFGRLAGARAFNDEVGSVTFVPVAQRIDLATQRLSRSLGQEAPTDEAVAREIRETSERWLMTVPETAFFTAIRRGSLTREQYVYAASNMHQFVRWTTRLLGRAVSIAHDNELRTHFLEHLRGEVNHERIIEADLNHLGEDVPFLTEDMVPNVGTRTFMANQEALIAFHLDPILFMASPIAAEGIAAHLDSDFMRSLNACVESWGVANPNKATRFFASHINSDGGDDGHWESTLAMVARRIRDEAHLQHFLTCLHTSQDALTRAYDSYVEELGVFSSDLLGHAVDSEVR